MLGGACGPGTAPAGTATDPVPTPALPLARLYLLEMTGIPADDTTVTFRTGTPRTIILRHGPPDNAPFVEIRFSAESLLAAAPESVTVTVRPRAGIYGVDITASFPPGPGSTVRFKYPVHFAAPVEALARYGSRARFERALSVVYLIAGDQYRLLESARPGPDNLEARLRGTGTYLVAAPR